MMADLQLGVSALAQNHRDFWPALYAAKPAFSISQLIMSEQIKQFQKERLASAICEKYHDPNCFMPPGVKRDEPFDMSTKFQSPTMDTREDGDPKSLNGKLVPVHCVVEIETRSNCSGRVSLTPKMEADSYVMVPGQTMFSEIIPVAMEKLGYQEEISEATAKLQVKHWKLLHLDQIAQPTDTVGRILGEMTNIATLKISIRRNCEKVAKDLREKLLRVILPQSKKVLSTLGCPLDEAWLERLSSDKLSDVPSDEMCRRFEDWFRSQNNNIYQQQQQASAEVQQEAERIRSISALATKIAMETPQGITSGFGPTSTRTRVRTSFDPEHELPRLQRWFLENQHPTRIQIQDYVQELNTLESRRGRKPLDIANIVYWFKNARAAQKRTESRLNGESKSPNYNSNDLSENEDDEILMTNDSLEEEPHGEPDITVKQEENDEHDNAASRTSRHSDSDDSGSDYEDFPDGPNDKVLGKSFQGESPQNLSCKEDRSTYHSESGTSWGDMPKFGQEQHQQLMERYSNFPVPGMGHAPLIGAGSLMYMPPYMNSFGQVGANGASSLSCMSEERRKRNRTFIDPVSEVPLLEHWFSLNTHPSHSMVVRFTEELNRQQYRQKFPKLEPKNVQFWFKNRRAKCKRLKTVAETDFS